MKWSVINKKLLYQGFFKLVGVDLKHDLFNGGESAPLRRELLDRGHAVAVLPYDPVRDEVVLIEQFRIGASDDASGPWLLETIAGIMEEGESAEELVHRESEEEAGCKVRDLIKLYHYYSTPGSSNEQIQVFFARTDTTNVGGIHGIDEEGEDIRVHVISSDTAFAWLDQGRIDTAVTIIALQWFRMNRDNIRRIWLS
jgi:ADP-ribose pyrophosphatase